MIVADARRRWSRAEKEAIVVELTNGTASVSAVARKHNIASSLLFRWRRQFAAKVPPARGERPFVPVALPAPVKASAPAPADDTGHRGMIEIELIGGRRLRVDASVDVTALRRMIDALEQR